MKNEKGMTLIEMLGAVALIGILGTVGITATSKYIAHSRAKSYKAMSQSIYEAAENCLIEGNCEVTSIPTDYLISEGYLDGLKNPIQSKHDCNGTVNVTDYGVADATTPEYNDYRYKVTLICEGLDHLRKDYVWPDAKSQKK